MVQFFVEESSRRSLGITSYLVSGGGAGAITCWFSINSLYGDRAPAGILALMLAASGLFLASMLVGFLAALAGFKAFDTAAVLPLEAFQRPYNRADWWLRVTSRLRIAAAALVCLGGAAVITAYVRLIWR